MDNENKKHENRTLHEAIFDSLEKGGKWVQKRMIPKAKEIAKLAKNEAQWIGEKSKDSAEKIKQSDIYAKIKDSAKRIQQSETVSKAKEAFTPKGETRSRKHWWYVGGAAVLVCLGLFLFGGGNDSNDYDSSYSGESRTESHSKSNSDIPHFTTPQDVLAFLSRHTFKSNEGLKLKIKSDGLIANGHTITSAPRVVDFSSDEATLRAHSPLNNADWEIWLVRTGDSYVVKTLSLPSYSNVETYYMVK